MRAYGFKSLAAFMLLFISALSAEARQGDFNWSGQVAAGDFVEIKGVNGRISAEPATGGTVEVVAEKRARSSDPKSVRIEVVEHAGGVTICSIYPSKDPSRPNTCVPGENNHMNVRNNDTSVNFTVRVPAGVGFRGRTVNGGITAENLAGPVEARTINGSVRISTSGVARASTVNGSIVAAMGRADWTNDLEFATVNGSIDLSLPASLSADVDASTINGQITTDFALTVTGRFSHRNLNGTVGGGGRELRLKTINGSVKLRNVSL